MNNHTHADTSIIEDAPGAQWSVYVDLLHGETRALRKTGAQGAAGGSGAEASFHDLTSTRSLHRDLGSCCWNKGSGERRRAIMQLCVLEFPLLLHLQSALLSSLPLTPAPRLVRSVRLS